MYTNQLVTVFRERFADLCDRADVPDSEIARELDVSKQTLSAWRCGTRSPKRPTLETIARYFGVNVDWLMGFDVPMRGEDSDNKKLTPEDELDNELVSLLSDLSPDEVVRVLDFVSGLKAAREAKSSHSK